MTFRVRENEEALLLEYVEAFSRKPHAVRLPLFTTNERIKQMDEWYEFNKIDKESRSHPFTTDICHFFETQEIVTMFILAFGGEYDTLH